MIYPPVEPITGTPVSKKNIILSVGRLHPLKKQNILIEIFRKAMQTKQLQGFELKLAGGLQKVDTDYFGSLQKFAKGLPIRFFPNATFDTLTKLYNESLIYWHAAGYGQTKPEHMEHFGITTVEAMSAGCIPVVFNGGGLPEIVRQNLWATTDECLMLTEKIIKNKQKQGIVRHDMIRQSKKFSVETFLKMFDGLLAKLT